MTKGLTKLVMFEYVFEKKGWQVEVNWKWQVDKRGVVNIMYTFL